MALVPAVPVRSVGNVVERHVAVGILHCTIQETMASCECRLFVPRTQGIRYSNEGTPLGRTDARAAHLKPAGSAEIRDAVENGHSCIQVSVVSDIGCTAHVRHIV